MEQRFRDTYGQDFVLPDFTMNKILEVILSKCFNRSATKRLSFVARDLLLIALTGLTAKYTIPKLPNLVSQIMGWSVYGFIQGCFGTGVWVLAHECGHQAFSPSRKLNDTDCWMDLTLVSSRTVFLMANYSSETSQSKQVTCRRM
jgi:omega-6 fatty acid desaturase (delta-12 desaturase)